MRMPLIWFSGLFRIFLEFFLKNILINLLNFPLLTETSSNIGFNYTVTGRDVMKTDINLCDSLEGQCEYLSI